MLTPKKLVNSILTDDRVLSLASLFSAAHGYTIETTLVEYSDGSHKLRIKGDLAGTTESNWQTIPTPPVNITDCLHWAIDNRIRELNTAKPMCRVSRFVLADGRAKWTIQLNRIQMGDSLIEQLASFLLSFGTDN